MRAAAFLLGWLQPATQQNFSPKIPRVKLLAQQDLLGALKLTQRKRMLEKPSGDRLFQGEPLEPRKPGVGDVPVIHRECFRVFKEIPVPRTGAFALDDGLFVIMCRAHEGDGNCPLARVALWLGKHPNQIKTSRQNAGPFAELASGRLLERFVWKQRCVGQRELAEEPILAAFAQDNAKLAFMLADHHDAD